MYIGTLIPNIQVYKSFLGSGDRKQVQIPTEVKLKIETQPDKGNKSPDKEIANMKTKALIACGGDFTIFIDDDGRIFATGNMHLQVYILFKFVVQQDSVYTAMIVCLILMNLNLDYI